MGHQNEHIAAFCWCDQCKEERRMAGEAAKQRTEVEAQKHMSFGPDYCGFNSHSYCHKCSLCIDCGDCQRVGCGECVTSLGTYVTAEAFRGLKQDYEDAKREITCLRRQVEQQGFTIAALHNDYAACLGQRDRADQHICYLRNKRQELSRAVDKLNTEVHQLRSELGHAKLLDPADALESYLLGLDEKRFKLTRSWGLSAVEMMRRDASE